MRKDKLSKQNIILYDDKASEIYSYNASVISEKHGTISSPIIIVANDAVLTPQYTTSCFTQASYFIRPHTDDAYTELAPLLRELDLESTIPALTYVSDGFREAFNHSLQMLILYGTQSLMLLLGLICLIVFSAKTFCENYRLKIAICLIEGSSAIHCCKRHVFINTVIYLVSLLFIAAASLLTQIAFSFSLLIIAFMLDQLLTVFLCERFSAGKLYSVVKERIKMESIVLDNISKSFGNKVLFNNYSLQVEEGDFVSIMGPSGSGKTTLLNMIGMLEAPDKGAVIIYGRCTPRFNSKESRMFRRTKISYLFQNYGLIDNETVAYNLSVSAAFKKIDKAKKERMFAQALEQVGLAGYEKRKIYTLSGGEQQRVAMAKNIIKETLNKPAYSHNMRPETRFLRKMSCKA